MAVWQFRPLNPNENSGASTVDDNFAVEERTDVEILVRETLQNPLDARARPDDKVKVSYRIVEVDTSDSRFCRSLFQEAWLSHAQSGQLLDGKLPQRSRFLIIEDFGTTGLEGAYDDSSVDGPSENWNAFWFREGEGAKQARSNGGAGQGKITLYLASAVRSVFALTQRHSDGKALLFGCSRFKRNYRVGSSKDRWAKEARWGSVEDPSCLAEPVTEPALIDAVKQELKLARGNEAGTSFIVPLPQEGLSEALIHKAVVNEFFFAICRGRLEVTVSDVVLNQSTIVAHAKQLGADARSSAPYREFLRLAAARTGQAPLAKAKPDWTKKLEASVFTEDELGHLKDAFELGEPVVVEFPLSIKSKAGRSLATTFQVFLQQDQELEKSEELFVRQDLAIDGEKKLKNVKAVMPVMALTFIDDLNLSEFLVCAEEPTHRTWNAQRPKVKANYVSPGAALMAVRNAASKLVQLLAPTGKRDETALALYFADPSQLERVKKGESGDVPREERPGKELLVDIPPAKSKPVSLKPRSDGFLVQATTSPDSKFVPLECAVQVAYATVQGDSFKLWDAADFWLNDEKRFPVELVDVDDLRRDGNQLRFVLANASSSVALSGFDAHRQLDIKLKYKEVADEADIAAN